MTLQSDCSFGFKKETTYGTAVRDASYDYYKVEPYWH